jgi:hypothetical protein
MSTTFWTLSPDVYLGIFFFFRSKKPETNNFVEIIGGIITIWGETHVTLR